MARGAHLLRSARLFMADAAGGGDVGAARVAQLKAVPAVLPQRLVRVRVRLRGRLRVRLRLRLRLRLRVRLGLRVRLRLRVTERR